MSSLISITDTEFETEVIQATSPVLVYFWATWCGPCRLVSPSIQWIADHYGDRLKVVKMDVDQSPETVHKYKVEGVPGIRLFKDTKLLVSEEGAMTKQKLVSILDTQLSKNG